MDCIALLSNYNEQVIQGKYIIKDIEDLYKVIINPDTRNILIKDDFYNKYFTETSLHEFRESVSKINTAIEVETERNYTTQYKRKALELGKLNTVDEIVDFFLYNRENGVHLLKSICSQYATGYNEALKASNKLSTVHLELLEAQNKVHTMETSNEKVLARSKDYQRMLDTLIKRINYSYEKDLSLDKFDNVNITTPAYKKVLYIKEITRVHYTDTFIYYLTEILKSLYSMPTRLLVMEAPYAYGRSRLYPECVPHTQLTYKDVYLSNIYMPGFQQKLVEDILVNASGLEYLIVLDRTGSDSVHITGESVEVLLTVSDLKDLNVDTHLSRVISYSDKTLSIPYIDDFDKLAPQARISEYSSMDITKSILELLERSN